MSEKKQIAILLNDTIQFYGIERILKEYFSPIDITFFSSLKTFAVKQNDSFDFYFTTPDLFLFNMDFFLPRKSKVIILTRRDEQTPVNSNIILTNSSLETIIEQLEPILTSSYNNNNVTENNKDLSGREVNVLQQIVLGHTNKEIADLLNISLNTVLSHRKNITSKLGIKTVSGLTFYAIMNGLISGEEIEL